MRSSSPLAADALRGNHPPLVGPDLLISVVVGRPEDPEALDRCLRSLDALTRPPAEVDVVEPGRSGRAPPGGGDLVAFIDGNAEADPQWLSGAARHFRDPRTAAVTGYVGPARLDTPAQTKLAFDSMCARIVDPFVLDGAYDSGPGGFTSPAAGALMAGSGANTIVRRRFLESAGLGFDHPTGIGAPALADLLAFHAALVGGYRVVFDPAQVAWLHLPPSDDLIQEATERAAHARRAFGSSRRVSARPPALRTLYGRDEPAAPSAPAGESASPRISVLVPTHGRRDKLLSLIGHLERQSFAPDAFEVVIVIDGDVDATAEALGAITPPFEMRVLEQEHRGVAAARNRAIAHARAPIVLFIDDDMEPEPDFLAQHHSAHGGGAGGVIVGYCPSDPLGDGMFVRLVQAWWEDQYVSMSDPAHQWTWLDFAVGNTSMPKALLDELGGFDESFARRNEDVDMGVRLAAAGVEFAFAPDARAWHRFESEPLRSHADSRRQGFYDVRLVEKYPRLRERTLLAVLSDDGTRLRRKPALVARSGRLVARSIPAAVRLASLCERAGLRDAWHRLTSQTKAAAYMLGVADALAAGSAVPAEVPEMETHLIELTTRGALSISPVGREPMLDVQYGGRPLVCIPAMPPSRPWNWDEVIARLTTACVPELRRGTTFGELAAQVSALERT